MPLKDPEKRKEYNRQRYLSRRAVAVKWQHDYYLAHRAEHDAYTRQWDKEHPEYKRERTARSRRNHPGREAEKGRKYRRKYPDKSRQSVSAYRHAHPERTALRAAEYRARQSCTVNNLTEREVKAMKAAGCFFADNTCSGPLAIAHDVPVVKGGNTTRGNTFVLCRHHNSEMHTRSLAEMLVQKHLPLL